MMKSIRQDYLNSTPASTFDEDGKHWESCSAGYLGSATASDYPPKPLPMNDEEYKIYMASLNRQQGIRTYGARNIIETRQKTHGDFDKHAYFVDKVKLAMRSTPRWLDLNPAQREAMDCTAMKMGRILCGDPNHPDHIDDLIGYATLFKEWSGK